MNRQSMSDAGYSMLGAGAWGWPREMLWGGRWEGGLCLGTHVRIKYFKIKKKNKLKTNKQKKIKKKIIEQGNAYFILLNEKRMILKYIVPHLKVHIYKRRLEWTITKRIYAFFVQIL